MRAGVSWLDSMVGATVFRARARALPCLAVHDARMVFRRPDFCGIGFVWPHVEHPAVDDRLERASRRSASIRGRDGPAQTELRVRPEHLATHAGRRDAQVDVEMPGSDPE